MNYVKKTAGPLGSGGRILVITGMSGAGKSQVVHCLEDMGYFCVDNLPPILFGKLLEGMTLSGRALPDTAIVADVRSGAAALPELEQVLYELRRSGQEFQVLFLEASDEVIVRRYKENRRPHPLAKTSDSSLLSCIKEERRLLAGLRGQADVVIDTSSLNIHSLTEMLLNRFSSHGDNRKIALTVVSFGFKYGLPIDADLVVDVRFLPNPFYVAELKGQSGLDAPVADFVLSHEVAAQFLQRYVDLLRFLLPNYQREGKKSLVLAVGCTGGRHRSVALAERIAREIGADGYATTLYHRDVARADQKG